MKALRPVIGFLMLGVPVYAGQVTAHILVTKRLTRKAVAPIVYNLRGTALPEPAAASAPASELDSVILWLEGGSATPSQPVSLSIEQRASRFQPDLVVIPVGSTVQFPNADPIFHNVFSLSKTQPFDLGFYPRGQTRSVKFNRPGIVQVYCHIHANMYAAIVVTSSPWYGRPSADGTYNWNNVPAGRYKLSAWHKAAGLHRVDVNVTDSGPIDATIRIPIDVEVRP